MTRDKRSKLLKTRLYEMAENSKTTYYNVFCMTAIIQKTLQFANNCVTIDLCLFSDIFYST